MTNKEKLSKLIIEKIHNLPYEEAINREIDDLYCTRCGDGKIEIKFPITIGRVMQALNNRYTNIGARKDARNELIGCWQLTHKNGQECTLDDLSEDTINNLLELLA